MDRQYLISYTPQQIEDLFKEKWNCSECPFVQVYTGKIPFGCSDYQRFYCKLRYVFRSGINFILNTAYTNIELDNLVEKIIRINPKESVNNTIPDMIKIHPFNPHLFIVSVLRVKELNTCPLDLDASGITSLSPTHKKEFEEWKQRYGIRGITVQDKILMKQERLKALNR